MCKLVTYNLFRGGPSDYSTRVSCHRKAVADLN